MRKFNKQQLVAGMQGALKLRSEITKLDKNKRLGPDPDQFGG